ncbi:MAG: hypothetical protein Q8S73_34405 [Deltaproteobacteria bacterium]|nr:hypothetical protein [Myxococcales bacterium]MDP3219242.1 hypothetical protein [Deltaproteobacteria bacterium]
MRRLLFPGLLLSLGLGCASSRIPNTDVPDTSENRDVIAFCERYRRAVESRDARALLAMASPRYFEDGGTPDGSDDYGLDGLQRLLTAWADEVNEVRYEIRYRRVSVSDTDARRMQVDFTYTGSYTLRRPAGVEPEPVRRGAAAGPPVAHLSIDPVRGSERAQQGEDVWYRRVADNRLELERDGDTIRIVSGM